MPAAGVHRKTDEARLRERFTRLAPQQKALRLALNPFCDEDGQADRVRWASAFASDDPERIVAVKAVTGLYEGLVNHLAEMLHVAARLRSLDVAGRNRRPSGPALFDASAPTAG